MHLYRHTRYQLANRTVYRKPCMYLTLRLLQSFHLNSWRCFTFENHSQAVEDSIDPFVWFRYLNEIQWNWCCLDAPQLWMSCRYISICWMHFWLKRKFQMSMQEKLRFITAFILILKLLSDTTSKYIWIDYERNCRSYYAMIVRREEKQPSIGFTISALTVVHTTPGFYDSVSEWVVIIFSSSYFV